MQFADLISSSRDSCRFLLSELLIFEFGEVGEVLVNDEDVLFFVVLLPGIWCLRGDLTTRKVVVVDCGFDFGLAEVAAAAEVVAAVHFAAAARCAAAALELVALGAP